MNADSKVPRGNGKRAARSGGAKGLPLLLPILSLYIALLLIVSFMACFFGYRQRNDALHARINTVMSGLSREYRDTVANFWQIYIPIFESGSNINVTLSHYFVDTQGSPLTPYEKNDLAYALAQMMLRDNRVEWIAAYSRNRDTNYILYHEGTLLRELPRDFPYREQLAAQGSVMEICGMAQLPDVNIHNDTFAICGGVPKNVGDGCILAGYRISPLEGVSDGTRSLVDSLNYYLLANGELVFTSGGNYDEAPPHVPAYPYKGIAKDAEGKDIYVRAELCGTNTSYLMCTASWWEMFAYSHGNTPGILLIVLSFSVLSVLVYVLMQRYINGEVNVIREGLRQIGENRLDHRIPTAFRQSGLSDIAVSINDMAGRLSENINRAFHYQIKQKEAELSELQSKFNPHFLYNTLEMLRARCHQSGDDETAGLITQLAAIFRGFIGSKTFIPLPEELTACRRYLSLLGARYGDSVEIRFDFDTELLRCGVIRNIFQPLIENYFVHGFDASTENNYILFRGKSLDAHSMLITVEDNGSGMDEGAMKELNDRLREPIELSTESYGLKNLHQRLYLFYGGDCGLSLARNGEKGLCVRMVLLKMTCGEYERGKDKRI